MNTQMSAFGFATYEIQDQVSTPDIIESCLNWRKEFLFKQEGILEHWFFTNLKGTFADGILAKDADALAQMASACENHPATGDFMSKLKPETITLRTNTLLSPLEKIPQRFACLEYGTFDTPAPVEPGVIAAAGNTVKTQYLSRFDEVEAHLMAQTNDNRYAELCFVRTQGAASTICAGYLNEPACQELLQHCNPQSAQLDFWVLIA